MSQGVPSRDPGCALGAGSESASLSSHDVTLAPREPVVSRSIQGTLARPVAKACCQNKGSDLRSSWFIFLCCLCPSFLPNRDCFEP